MTRIECGIKLSVGEVRALLDRFDDTFSPALSLGVDLDSYSEKLSSNAQFVIANISSSKGGEIVGFIAYYLNDVEHFCYVPLTAVYRNYMHKGIGHNMFESLLSSLGRQYNCVRLEVLKTNKVARMFYCKLGFGLIEDRGEKFLLQFNM